MTDWRLRASISFGSVTLSGGVGAASGPTPSDPAHDRAEDEHAHERADAQQRAAVDQVEPPSRRPGPRGRPGGGPRLAQPGPIGQTAVPRQAGGGGSVPDGTSPAPGAPGAGQSGAGAGVGAYPGG